MIRNMTQNTEAKNATESNYIVVMKGAPERIFDRCSKILVKGKELDINDYWRDGFEAANTELGNQGERVLAFARVYLDPAQYPQGFEFNMKEDSQNFPMENLTFIGIVSLNDPPR
jgi:sodium/potassium-transporting ATPase subunit alpha